MGLQAKSVKQKIKSVRNIGKITKTMEMVSVSKMKKATERVMAGRPYSKYVLELLHNIATEKHITHPLLETKKADRILLVVISSNKGLSGAYNLNITKALATYKKMRQHKKIDCVTVGRQAEKSVRLNKLNLIASFVHFSEKSTSEDFWVMRDLLLTEFQSGKYEAVKILFTEFKSAMNSKPFLMQLLPLKENLYSDVLISSSLDPKFLKKENEKKDTFANYIFEPDENEVLEIIIRQLLEQALFNIFLESQASEHSSRMLAMKNASDNAKNIVDDLTLYYNQVRQGAITQELSEIVAGATTLN